MTINYTQNPKAVGFSNSKLHNQNLVEVRNETKQIGFIEAYITENKNSIEINLGASKNVDSNPFLNEIKFIATEDFENTFARKFNDHNSITLRRKTGDLSPKSNHTVTYVYTFTKNVLEKGNDTPEKLSQVIEKFVETLSEFRGSSHLANAYRESLLVG